MDEGSWEWTLASGVIWELNGEICFTGWERRRERTSVAQLSHHRGEWKKDRESCLVQLLWVAWIEKPQPNRNTPLNCCELVGEKEEEREEQEVVTYLDSWNETPVLTVSQLTTCFHLVKKTEATIQGRILCSLWLLFDITSKSNKKKALLFAALALSPEKIQSSLAFKATTYHTSSSQNLSSLPPLSNAYILL